MAVSSMVAVQRRAVTMHPLLLIVLLTFIREANSFVDPSTTNALIRLRDALNPPMPSPVLGTWGPGDPCIAGWGGIVCFPPDIAALQQVVNLTLSGQGLTGSLPQDLNGLNGLQLLDLSNNPNLTGSVASLALLADLQHLNLNGTGFSSDLEPLMRLTNLVTLRLGYAMFALGLPTSFPTLQQLRVLDLRSNFFSGDFPNVYGMNALEELYLSGNDIAGQIPATALVLPNLRIVDLSANKLDGLLPPDLYRAVALTELRLFRNLLDGSIPPEYALFGNLTILDLHSNTLNGTLPPGLPRGGALQQLYIQDNPSIVGPIPPSYESIAIFVKDPTLAYETSAPSEPPPNTGIPSNDSSGAIGSESSAPPVLPGEGSTSNVPSPPVTSSEAVAPQVSSSPASTECQCQDGKVQVNNSSCECKFAIIATIRLLNYTYENFIASEEQRREVKDLIADDLSVARTQIQLVNITKGSVILTFYVLPPANAEALNRSEEPVIREKINNMTNEELGTVETKSVLASPSVRDDKMGILIRNPSTVPYVKKSWWTGLRIALVAIALGIIVAVLFVITAFFVLRKWNRPRPGGQPAKKPSRNSGALERAGPHTPPAMTAKKYTMKDLDNATTSFGINSLVGEGQFGIVFQGKIDGMVKAVKKLDASLGQTEIDFYNVIGSLARLRHPNIVELQGYCVEARDRVLVYEFVDNGTLQDHLHGKKDERKPSMLLWDQRMRIATGIAKALEVLHSARPAIVHRNFKTANVLLTKDLSPKVSDCGLLALAPHGANRQVSAQMLGTFGYSAPEYAMTGKHTVKSDVYSFGVVLLELMTGRRPLDSNRPKVEQSLVRWAVPQLGDVKAVIKMADPLMSGRYPHDVIKKFALIISDCLQPEQELRPSISDVVQLLNRISDGAGSATKFTKTPEALDQFLGDVSDDSYV